MFNMGVFKQGTIYSRDFMFPNTSHPLLPLLFTSSLSLSLHFNVYFLILPCINQVCAVYHTLIPSQLYAGGDLSSLCFCSFEQRCDSYVYFFWCPCISFIFFLLHTPIYLLCREESETKGRGKLERIGEGKGRRGKKERLLQMSNNDYFYVL